MTSESLLERIQRRPFIPILVLLFFLLLLGWANSDYYVLNGRPIVISDSEGAVAFYDSPSIDAASKVGFAFRSSPDGKVWSKEKRVSGRMKNAILSAGRLYLLYPTFISTYDRDGFKRLETYSLKDLPFEADQISANGDGSFSLFGIDKQQNLRAAQVKAGTSLVVDSKIENITKGTDKKEEAKESEPSFLSPVPKIQEAGKDPIHSTHWSTARIDSSTYILMGSVPGKGSYPLGVAPLPQKSPDRSQAARVPQNGLPRQLKLATFNIAGAKSSFASPVLNLDIKAVAATLFVQGKELRMMCVETKTSENMDIYRLKADGKSFEKLDSLPYEKGGWLSNQGVSSLSVASLGEKRLVLAQIGGSIRLNSIKGDESKWHSMSRLAGETKTLVYGWFTAVLLLALLLILAGVQTYRQRRLEWPNVTGRSTDADLQSFIDRNSGDSEGEDGDSEVPSPEQASDTPERKSDATPAVDSHAVSDSSTGSN
ncbi:MAG: hypothetical protein P1V97_37685 [Planctomycetota bacterium]|nr:hypothetical protein [Planctomycetota bacterium]